MSAAPEIGWLETQLSEHAHLERESLTYKCAAAISWIEAASYLAELHESQSLQDLKNKLEGCEKIKNKTLITAALNDFFMAASFQIGLQALELSLEHEAITPPMLTRSAMVTWYYAIYFSARASISSFNKEPPNCHAPLANLWGTMIASRELATLPFSEYCNTLVEAQFNKLYDTKKTETKSPLLISLRGNLEKSMHAYWAYYNGAVKKERDRINSQTKKAHGIENFRSEKNKNLRDKKLDKHPLCFMHLAYRFRESANYQSSLLLTYNHDNHWKNDDDGLKYFIKNLAFLSRSFLKLTRAHIVNKIPKDDWQNFSNDMERKASFSMKEFL